MKKKRCMTPVKKASYPSKRLHDYITHPHIIIKDFTEDCLPALQNMKGFYYG